MELGNISNSGPFLLTVPKRKSRLTHVPCSLEQVSLT